MSCKPTYKGKRYIVVRAEGMPDELIASNIHHEITHSRLDELLFSGHFFEQI